MSGIQKFAETAESIIDLVSIALEGAEIADDVHQQNRKAQAYAKLIDGVSNLVVASAFGTESGIYGAAFAEKYGFPPQFSVLTGVVLGIITEELVSAALEENSAKLGAALGPIMAAQDEFSMKQIDVLVEAIHELSDIAKQKLDSIEKDLASSFSFDKGIAVVNLDHITSAVETAAPGVGYAVASKLDALQDAGLLGGTGLSYTTTSTYGISHLAALNEALAHSTNFGYTTGIDNDYGFPEGDPRRMRGAPGLLSTTFNTVSNWGSAAVDFFKDALNGLPGAASPSTSPSSSSSMAALLSGGSWSYGYLSAVSISPSAFLDPNITSVLNQALMSAPVIQVTGGTILAPAALGAISRAGELASIPNVGNAIPDKIHNLGTGDLKATLNDLEKLRAAVQYDSPTQTAHYTHLIRDINDELADRASSPAGLGSGGWGSPGATEPRDGGNVSGGSGGSSGGGGSGSGLAGGGTQGHGGEKPVVLDLDGDGIELIPRALSSVSFDIDNDGYKERTAWVGPNDGLLVVDLNGDGKIDKAEELAFAAVTSEDDTDLEALAKLYDSSKDGHLTKDDGDWSKLRVWQDANSDGITDDGELRALDQLGITDISLVSDKQQAEILGSTLFGTAAYSKSDGSGGTTSGKVADLSFDADALGYKTTELPNGIEIEFEGAGAAFLGNGDIGVTLNLNDSNFGLAIGSGGNDVFASGQVGSDIQGVALSGGLGNDSLTGGDGGDRIDGGEGQDKIDGGKGDDLLFVDSDDTLIQGGQGTDIAVVATNSDFAIDLAAAGLEIVQGGGGNDLLDGSKVAPYDDGLGVLRGVSLDGGDGDDTLLGSEGGDTLTGARGSDIIRAGSGDDTIIAAEADEIDAGEGFDRVIFTDSVGLTRDAAQMNAEWISGGSGDDHFSTSDTHVVWLYGNGGDDFLEGSRGGDQFAGGRNDDAIIGGAGNDTYLFAFGDGQDEITDADDYWVQRSDPKTDKHTLTTTYTYQRYTWVTNQDGTNGHWVGYDTVDANEQIQVLDYDIVIQPEHIHADGGKDTIEFSAGITQIDLIFEFRGADLYVGLKDSNNPGAKASELADSIRLVNWVDPLDRVETIKFADGSTVDIATLVTIPTAPVLDPIRGGAGNDTLTGTTAGDQIQGDVGDDTLAGGKGDDRLEGGAGNDSYVFGRGDAWDVIRDENKSLQQTTSTEIYTSTYTATMTYITGYYTGGGPLSGNQYDTKTFTFTDSGPRNITTYEWKVDDGGTDTLSFAAGITIEDVAVKIRGNDLLIALRDPSNASASFWELSDRLRIENWADSEYCIENFKFADGTIIDVSSMVAAYAGGEGDEVVTGDETTNWLAGSGGNDVMLGLEGNDVIIGGTGDDVLAGGSGADWLFGGADNDFADYSDSVQGVTVDLTNNANNKGGDAEGDKLSGIENVIGSRSNDKITGDTSDNIIYGGDGADTIDGGVGNDTACYSDSIFAVQIDLSNSANNNGGYAQGDVLTNIENLTGSSFDDVLTGNGGDNRLEGGLGKDQLVGGAGNDTAIYAHSAGVQVDLAANKGTGGDAESDTYTSIENVLGSDFADKLTGNTGDNKLDGGKGEDVLQGGAGNDTLDGGEGNDTASYASSASAVTVKLADNTKNAGGDAAGDTLVNIENLTGSAGDDGLTGSDGDNVLEGGKGADTLAGGLGNDTATYANSEAGITVNLKDQTQNQGGDAGTAPAHDLLSGIENLTGSKYNDTLTGDDGDNRLVGGEGLDSLNGGAGNDFLDGGTGNDTIIGGAGIDTVSYAGALAGVTLDLSKVDSNGFATASGGSAADQVKEVENIIGGIFADTLTGDAGNNRLEGGSGNDTLDGGIGADTLVGGFGRDVYRVDNANDVIVEDGLFDIDRVESSVTWALGANLEDLTLTGTAQIDGTGNELDNILTGNVANNRLDGGKASDTLDGGAGADTLVGGQDDDFYVVDDVNDVITEAANEGTDSVKASVTYTLSAEVEYLYLTGTKAIDGTGNTSANILVGNDAANKLTGGAGNDTLNGGLGADTLDGGADIDLVTYAASKEAVNVNLATGKGTGGEADGDTFTNVENLTGTDFNDTLTGSASDNRLDGGKGNDTMAGGAGNDTYVVDAAGDVVIENASEGTDTVESSVDYTLGANLENLTLTGVADINSAGNSLDNVMIGNDGDNIIDGQNGKDTIKGGRGNDIYRVDNVGDVAIEEDIDGEWWGHDRVESYVGFVLGKNIEDLTLQGTGNVYGHGNELDNLIIGNVGDNELKGNDGDDTIRGGAGADGLYGGNGNDTVSYEDSADGVTVNLATNAASGGYAENDTIREFENAIGSSYNDALTGTDGDNRLDGLSGNDTMTGGKGDDVYVVANGGDVVAENAAEGYDRVEASTAHTLAANVEELLLTGSSDLNGTGNALDNVITGNSGANRLDGVAGNDTLAGGLGNDTYVADSNGDVVNEYQGGGIDTVESAITYVLSQNLENLTLTGANAIDGTGTGLDNDLTGNSGANKLSGLAGNDTLVGGAGNDTLIGGEGIDTVSYSASTSAATVNLATGTATDGLGGTDTLQQVENVIGTWLNDSLTGDASENRLEGGNGADTMKGGAGSDAYVIDNVGDVVTENANEGRDTVESSISYTLGANVEDLVLTGHYDLNGTGNVLENIIIGNDGNNKLDGGAGADALAGGFGNDVYVVDDVADRVAELADQGTDRVESSVDWTLGDNLEDLTLTGTAVNGTGNTLANKIIANATANTLKGEAGDDIIEGAAGADTLDGGDGIDTLSYGGSSAVVAVNLGTGTASGGDAAGDSFTGFESVTGSAYADTLTGDDTDNRLDGGAGADTLTGGKGNDTYVVDNAGDVVTEAAGEGTDTVEASIAIAALASNVENLTLTGTADINGTGNTLDNYILGNAGKNALSGADGNDTLEGGVGADTLTGGNGIDTASYANSSAAVTVNLATGAGSGGDAQGDVLSGVESLTGSVFGDALTGDAGENRIDGGRGADTMAGGTGNDTYVVDNTGDVVTEAASAGTDTVEASISYTLAANVENLVLTGTADLNGTGNSLNNQITGNDGNNRLDGGAGSDALIGGKGNDTYVVDSLSDVVTELADDVTNKYGTDTVEASVDNYVLANNVENLTLTSIAITGTGNALANVITGTDSANTLNGDIGDDTLIGGKGADALQGGAGNDTASYATAAAGVIADRGNSANNTGDAAGDTYTSIESLTGSAFNDTLRGDGGDNRLDGGKGNDALDGGLGNDTYVVDSTGDTITDAGGTDTVEASITWTIAGNAALENVTLVGSYDISATGNANANALKGNDGNNVLDGGTGADTLTGGKGHDYYYVDNTGDQVVEAADEGIDTIESTISFDLSVNGQNIENLTLTIGSSNLNGTGNALDNVIRGNAGNNQLTGGAGNDRLIGGGGTDTLDGGDGNDALVTDGGDVIVGGLGIDTVESSVDYTLGSDVENLTLTGSAISGIGNTLDNRIIGNAQANVLDGGAGNDFLDGGAGNDTMKGGTGDDVYVVRDAGDQVVENASEGTDRVDAYVDVTLAANVEDLTLLGTGNLKGTGNALNNMITGNAGDNVLDGGIGTDTLVGGKGNDTYIVDTTTDTITELENEGTDTVQASATYTLGANLEDLTLTGTSTIDGTGNALDNVLIGNSGNNKLDAQDGNDRLDGGGGTDTLIGGKGNDVYVVDTTTDAITENLDEGYDRVEASVTFTLSNNIEDLKLTGTGSINGTGNALSNRIIGNDSNNQVTGNAGDDYLDGGKGNDTLTGGAGSDVYIVDSAGDSVVETDTNVATGGYDVLFSAVTFDLSIANTAGAEDLVLTGTGNIDGTGNALANRISGTDGDNKLNGGAGNDTLTGGKGNDYYYVDSTGDVVNEAYNEGTDTIESTVDWTLGVDFENLTLTGSAINGTGNASDNVITGNANANKLVGDVGDDTLIGGAGSDTLYGGLGNDTVSYAGSNAAVNVNLSTGSASGGHAAGDVLQWVESLTGSDYNDTLVGDDGVNRLDGGKGNDSMAGNAGNDTYVVDSATDSVVEAASEGNDTVEASVTYTLTANVENLRLAGASAINGTGNTLNNSIVGTSAANTLAGGAGNDTLEGGAGADSLIGGTSTTVDSGTLDLASYAGAAAAVTIDLTLQGGSAQTGGDADGDKLYGIEGVIGSTYNDKLIGTGGDNWLDGGGGNDTLIGGAGNDTYRVHEYNTVIQENASEGADTVIAAGSFDLSVSAANVENLTLDGSSPEFAYGNSLANKITGNSGNNVLFGGSDSVADTLIGGDGDDTYVLVDTLDTITENASEGTDAVEANLASGTYTLGSNLENLKLTGTNTTNGTGNTLNNLIIGNIAANTLIGGAGNDTLEGGGGGDSLIGGTATTTDSGTLDIVSYVSSSAAVSVDLSLADGTAQSGGDAAGDKLYGIEGIVGSAYADTLTGDSGINRIEGGGGNDTISAGAANDQVYGDEGDDILIGGAGADVLNGSSGTDTASYVGSTAAVTVNLATGAASGGDAASDTFTSIENLIGSGYADNLTGTTGANRLDGGVGADTMTGGAGNDTYVVDNASDTITELANEGTDTIESGITFDLSTKGANVESLTLTGASALNGTGNTLDNVLTGNSAVNTLTGNDGNDTLVGNGGDDTLNGGNGNDVLQGGAGNDVLNGGAGSDICKFGRGDGSDQIAATASDGVADKLSFGDDIASDQLWFTASGSDLVISIIGTSDTMTVKGWYTGGNDQLDSIEISDGEYLLASDVSTLVNAMNSLTPPPLGQTSLTTQQQQQLAPALASSWHPAQAA